MPNLFNFNVKKYGKTVFKSEMGKYICLLWLPNQQIYLKSKSKNCMQNVHFWCGMYETALKGASDNQCQGKFLLHYKQ